MTSTDELVLYFSVIKPIVKKDDEVTEPKRVASPELARFAPLVTRQPKQKGKVSEAEPVVAETSIKVEPKVKESKKAAVVSGSSKDTVAFYHVSTEYCIITVYFNNKVIFFKVKGY